MSRSAMLLLLFAFVACAEASFLQQTKTFILSKVVSRPTLSAEHHFTEFKTKFGKKYSEEEHAKRFGIFQANLERIAELNQEHNPHAEFAVTKFADLTSEEFAEKMRCRSGNTTSSEPMQQWVPDLKAAVPESVDWTTKGAVTDVKDQGQCGSCWAFGTTGVVEGAWFLAGNELIPLSEEELVQCEKADLGCNGGLQSDALAWIKKKGGIVAEKTYPYTSGSGKTGKCKKNKETPIAASIKSWANVSPKKDADALKAAVAKQPVTIAVNAGTDLFQFYNKGVMTASHEKCNPSNLDHAVLTVGYGSTGTKDYWKVKNSWAADWGEDGYFRIERGADTCGCESDAQIATA